MCRFSIAIAESLPNVWTVPLIAESRIEPNSRATIYLPSSAGVWYHQSSRMFSPSSIWSVCRVLSLRISNYCMKKISISYFERFFINFIDDSNKFQCLVKANGRATPFIYYLNLVLISNHPYIMSFFQSIRVWRRYNTQRNSRGRVFVVYATTKLGRQQCVPYGFTIVLTQ